MEITCQVLVKVKAGVEHLADKLQYIKTVWNKIKVKKEIIISIFQAKSHVPTANLSPASDEYVLNLLSSSEEKLLKLLEDLDGAELPSILCQTGDNEVWV